MTSAEKLDAAITLLLNAMAANKVVSDIITQRLAENRDWTEAELKTVDDELKAAKDYARSELGKPD